MTFSVDMAGFCTRSQEHKKKRKYWHVKERDREIEATRDSWPDRVRPSMRSNVNMTKLPEETGRAAVCLGLSHLSSDFVLHGAELVLHFRKGVAYVEF